MVIRDHWEECPVRSSPRGLSWLVGVGLPSHSIWNWRRSRRRVLCCNREGHGISIGGEEGERSLFGHFAAEATAFGSLKDLLLYCNVTVGLYHGCQFEHSKKKTQKEKEKKKKKI